MNRFIFMDLEYQLSQREPLSVLGGIQLQLTILVEMESTRRITCAHTLREREWPNEGGG